MAALAAEFYGHPSRSMSVVGITGTNGKTTTAYLLRAVFEAAGKKCGLLGTVTYSVGDEELPASRTTPEAPDVQRMFRRMVDSGCGACVMEVSSHALALQTGGRDDVCSGRVHKPDSRSSRLPRRHGVVLRREEAFVRDAPGRRARCHQPRRSAWRDDSAKSPPRPVTYAINKPADVTPGPLTLTFDGLEFDVRTPTRQRAREVEARRPAQRLEHSRDRGGRDGTRSSVCRDRAWARQSRRRARPLRGGVGSQATTSPS